MSQARLPRTEPSTELITAHKVNTATLMPPVQTRDFSALPKHRAIGRVIAYFIAHIVATQCGVIARAIASYRELSRHDNTT